jgi:DNA-directed RNA polymerase subunit H (RpoH/RPB5)
MEERALETLRAILARRGLPTTTTPAGDHEYTMGNFRVVFVQDKNPTQKALEGFIEANPDNLLLIIPTRPSELLRASIRSHADKTVQVFYLAQLQFDIMTHAKYGFPARLLSNDEKQTLQSALRLTNLVQLPRVSFDDPYALWLGARVGDVIEYEIPSEAAGWSKKYRYVVADVGASNLEEV